VAGSSASAPYLYELDLAPYPEGTLSIAVIAYGGDGAELASAATTITVEVLTLYEKVLAGDLQAVRQVSIWAGIGGGVVAILLIILGISMARRRRKARAQAQVWDSTDTLAFGIPGTRPAPAGGVPNPAVRGVLVVEKSDDADMIGQRFEIANDVTNLGRSADNDVMFPKDTPVSRRHAQITARADGLYLGEVETIDEGGQARRPTYGTFVNGKKLEQAPVLLMNGDAIKLGDRTVLRFEASQPPTPADEKTYLGPVSEDMETRLIAKKK
jgi:pSer/pThr/pTyr-binding forkhead associated (FHA) protein